LESVCGEPAVAKWIKPCIIGPGSFQPTIVIDERGIRRSPFPPRTDRQPPRLIVTNRPSNVTVASLFALTGAIFPVLSVLPIKPYHPRPPPPRGRAESARGGSRPWVRRGANVGQAPQPRADTTEHE